MKDRTNENDMTAIPAAPNLALLRQDFDDCVNASASYVTEQARNYNTRFALWDLQNSEGVKLIGENGEDPKPWKRSSDVRIFEADAVINEQVAVMMAAWHRGAMQLSATQVVNQWAALKGQQLMHWLLKVQLADELDAEVERYCQWRQQWGYVVMGVFWEQQPRTDYLKFDLFTMAREMGLPEGGPALLAFKELVLDPLNAPILEAQFMQQWGLSQRVAEAKVKEFRSGAEVEIPRMIIEHSLPRWTALRPYTDIVHRPGARNLQRNERIYVREWLTEIELKDRASLHGYDEKWVDEAIEKKGQAPNRYGQFADYFTGLAPGRRTGEGWTGFGDADSRDLIEVIHAYQLGIDPKTRRPIRWCTAFHPNIPDRWGSHEPAQYKHGKAPFVPGIREVIDVAMCESRGVPDIVNHDQRVIKTEVDTRRDAAQMITLPPLVKPVRRGKEKLKLGPAAQLTETTPGELRFMPTPSDARPSVEIEEAARRRINRYFGRISDDVPLTLQELHNQHLATKTLRELGQMGDQTMALAQQYLEPTKAEIVANGITRVLFSGTREDIQGKFKFGITFDVRDLNTERVEKKIDGITKILQLDTFGTIDRAGVSAWGLAALDPDLAERFIRPQEEATESEMQDEDNALLKIFGGLEPAPPPENANAPLRMQRLQERLMANPMLKKVIESRPDIQAMLETRAEQLQHLVTQRQNAMIGRTGATPGLAKLRQGQLAGGGQAAGLLTDI